MNWFVPLARSDSWLPLANVALHFVLIESDPVSKHLRCCLLFDIDECFSNRLQSLFLLLEQGFRLGFRRLLVDQALAPVLVVVVRLWDLVAYFLRIEHQLLLV